MKTYLVGGAVRDKLLGKAIKERDYVVVGATKKEMEDLGFKKVGRDFPVFLHPQTHEEYALARTERKTGKGYIEFACFSDPSVTLEDDLKRRDLTINAIAEDEHGNIIDPYNGRADLQTKTLRHVSEAFTEDPVRILRVARFAAKLEDFNVDPTTNLLMRQMLLSGEVDALVPERVWQEFLRALLEKQPQRFFAVIDDCGVLQKLFPEIHAVFPALIPTLKKAVQLSAKPEVRFAAIMRQLTREQLKNLCNRYKIPTKFAKLASLIISYYQSFQNAVNLTAAEILELLERIDAFRSHDRFVDFLLACEANLPQENFPSEQYQKLQNNLERLKNLDLKNLIPPNLSGIAIKNKIHELRLQCLQSDKSL